MPSDGQSAFAPFCLSCCFPNVKLLWLEKGSRRLRSSAQENACPFLFCFSFLVLFSLFLFLPFINFPLQLCPPSSFLTHSLGTIQQEMKIFIFFFPPSVHFLWLIKTSWREENKQREHQRTVFLCLVVNICSAKELELLPPKQRVKYIFFR